MAEDFTQIERGDGVEVGSGEAVVLRRALPAGVAGAVVAVMAGLSAFRLTVGLIAWVVPDGLTGNPVDGWFETIVVGVPVGLIVGALCGAGAAWVTYRRADELCLVGPISTGWETRVVVLLALLAAGLAAAAAGMAALSVSYAVMSWMHPPRPSAFLIDDGDAMVVFGVLLYGIPAALLTFAVTGAWTQAWLTKQCIGGGKTARSVQKGANV